MSVWYNKITSRFQDLKLTNSVKKMHQNGRKITFWHVKNYAYSFFLTE